MSYDHFRVFCVFRGLKIFVRFAVPGKTEGSRKQAVKK